MALGREFRLPWLEAMGASLQFLLLSFGNLRRGRRERQDLCTRTSVQPEFFRRFKRNLSVLHCKLDSHQTFLIECHGESLFLWGWVHISGTIAVVTFPL